jgi:hypothetical protein
MKEISVMSTSHDIRARFETFSLRGIGPRHLPGAPRAGRPSNRIAAACWLLAAAAALLPPGLPAAPKPPAQPTLKEVLAKSLAARGGAQKLHAVATRREIGMLALGAGNEWPFIVEHQRPNRLRMEIELQGAQLIRIFDGAHGWQKQPQAPAPEALGGDDLHNIANEADFDNALVDTSAKGKAELLGREAIGGHDAWKVQVTLLSGDVFEYYVDAVTYLPIHWEGSRLINGKPVVFASDFNDYREAGGVKYPFQILSSIKGSAQQQKITFTKIEINPPLDDARFTPASIAAPSAATPPATAPPPQPSPKPTPPPPPAATTTPPPSPPPPAPSPRMRLRFA